MSNRRAAAAQAARDERWQEALRRLPHEPVRCLDTETSGLDWRHNHIVGWVLTFSPNPADSYYLPVRHAPGGNILDYRGPSTKTGWDRKSLHPIEGELLRNLDQPGTLVFGHNLGFDLKFMWALGMQAHDAWFECTQTNASLINEHGKFSLEWCCQQAKVQAKKSELICDYIRSLFPEAAKGDEMGHYWRLRGDDPYAVEYGEGDGTSTWQLRDWQWDVLGAEELTQVHDVESRLLPVLVRMSCRGIRADEERVRQIVQRIDSGELERELGMPPDFNAKAPKQVEAWLRDQGITNWGKTATGKPQFNEEWLSTFPAGQKIVTLRRSRTLKDSFMLPMLNGHIWNGRVHTTYNQTKTDDYGTVTGRLSCSDPNLQQASKRDPTIGRLHRSCFLADEGMIWGSADYAQCEPVLLAIYSGAKVLVDGFCADPPEDAHSAVTKAINSTWHAMSREEFRASGIDKTPEFKAARQTGKRVNQTLLTGGGQGVLTKKYGIPPAEVKRIWADYFRALPEIKKLQKDSERVMRNRGYVVSLLGRRARLRNWPMDKSKSYTSVNRLLQCGNADIMKLKLVEIDDYLKSEGRPMDILNTVHDSLDFQFHPDARHHYEQCLRIMTDFGPNCPIQLWVPLNVDFDEGPDWATATFGAET